MSSHRQLHGVGFSGEKGMHLLGSRLGGRLGGRLGCRFFLVVVLQLVGQEEGVLPLGGRLGLGCRLGCRLGSRLGFFLVQELVGQEDSVCEGMGGWEI